MMSIQVLSTDDSADWDAYVTHSDRYDFHHLQPYHALEEESGSGEARLFVYCEGDYRVALPLLLRPVRAVPCHVDCSADWFDATSVYGYAGPITSHAVIPDAILREFRSALRDSLFDLGVVSVFTRLHPLVPQPAYLEGLGECIPVGQTVSIDLTLPIEVQRAAYRKDYKRQINRLRRLGAVCFEDRSREYLAEFVDIYLETMRRVDAAEGYHFDRAYFEALVAALGDRIHLFVCRMEDTTICAGLFTSCSGIVQAHLVGTRNEYFKLSPTKLLFDTVRLWASEEGARVFHLGGGVGGSTDSLFHFKAGFSDQRHPFVVWRWLLAPDRARSLEREKKDWTRERGLETECPPGFFPAYRCPACTGCVGEESSTVIGSGRS